MASRRRQEDVFIREYRRLECQIKDMESRSERGAAYLALIKKAEPVRRAAEYYRAKYAKTYNGKPFDAIEAFERYISFCWQLSSRGSDLAPSEKTWKRYRQSFMERCKK